MAWHLCAYPWQKFETRSYNGNLAAWDARLKSSLPGVVKVVNHQLWEQTLNDLLQRAEVCSLMSFCYSRWNLVALIETCRSLKWWGILNKFKRLRIIVQIMPITGSNIHLLCRRNHGTAKKHCNREILGQSLQWLWLPHQKPDIQHRHHVECLKDLDQRSGKYQASNKREDMWWSSPYKQVYRASLDMQHVLEYLICYS